MAISEGRVPVTADLEDFMFLITGLSESRTSHTGCILVPKSVRNEDFGSIISGVGQIAEHIPQSEWTDRVVRLQKR